MPSKSVFYKPKPVDTIIHIYFSCLIRFTIIILWYIYVRHNRQIPSSKMNKNYKAVTLRKLKFTQVY